MRELRLGVNIDHVATLRNARGVRYPDPVAAASIAERAGADGITIHLREDRRHITDRDVAMLKQTLNVPMNLEMAVTDEMIDIAVKTQPTFSCLVPEKREELTTEGGLDVAGQVENIANATKRLTDAGIQVSLFIDADRKQIDAAKEAGAPIIELHTGQYAEADTEEEQKKELARLMEAAEYAHSIGLQVNAGHGLHYHNTLDVAQIPQMVELNIGHSIIARAVLDGLDKAVRDMREILDKAR
ncbi:pyridoxine 5'-phosphate synthase [Idiomarina sp. WRN-38]|jgi:pyridoxine 5-phosphate synthase|uniref:pyridoxine 5'-phosphate synthase n=1 Tax=unclassified Idiomarina TaxID=2614829 RepID=UPI00073349E5|nr:MULTISPECIES: pyridoxine 5'-phosphate synthase [unclassified Idiomarina]KTG23885.1 pyridoxine 5'-phosphate synthase [Idiomarina sp. H105]MBF38573.1 pyridoxine 5'-phosphate synthase [Idiomarinaceae bacterium]OAE91276.1 pyridoxine 5'-phosphate synthase [Idiomarina sp. WRN-38]MCH2456034.1 pyridoxine 5'-phosphate synthase [Idiomarina sp.]MCJ8315575.1 pyridoxine 5'-phosphate synthase [Idiomarina sp.]|tara:strand:+ start:10847 stop:11575 length:729 start_codon:yes stop_codon:yes gene_type:complete